MEVSVVSSTAMLVERVRYGSTGMYNAIHHGESSEVSALL